MLDPRRIDGEKLQFHPVRVAQWLLAKGDKEWGPARTTYPVYVEVSPIGACNHRCTFCSVDYIGYKARQLETDLLSARLMEMGSLGVRSVMFAGEGEPLLHKGINHLVQAALTGGMDVSFTTNGVLLDKLMLDGVSWVKVSINGGDRDTYAKVHQTKPEDFDRVLANISGAASRKGSCAIGAQIVLLPENEHSAASLCERLRDSGCDYLVFKPYMQAKYSINRIKVDYADRIEALEEIAQRWSTDSFKVVVRDESMRTKEIPYTKCHATPFMWAYIMATGDVYTCSAYLLDDRFKIGNIKEASFADIWHSEKRRACRDYVRDQLDIKECRKNCRMDKVNRYLDGFDTTPDINFI